MGLKQRIQAGDASKVAKDIGDSLNAMLHFQSGKNPRGNPSRKHLRKHVMHKKKYPNPYCKMLKSRKSKSIILVKGGDRTLVTLGGKK